MSANAQIAAVDTAGEHGPGSHDALFVKTAIILAVVTFVEVAWSFMPWSEWGTGKAFTIAEVGGLLLMMSFKFFVVASVFMHLKFERKLLTGVFYFGVIIAVVVYVAVLATFEVFTVPGGLKIVPL